ncbi:MAG: hypothetical protein LBH03_01165 [Holophagales bacterium]|jgi:hypothetical protein|nr:hypothetical protein [Holophagales bacterium]
MNHRVCAIALTLGLAPLALTLGCEKKLSEEEIIAKYQADLEKERVAKLEQELADLKDKQEVDNAVAKQIKNDHQAVLEKQIQEAKRKAEQAEQAAKEAKEAKATNQKPTVVASNTSNAENSGDASRGGERRRPAVVSIPKGTQLFVFLSQELSTDTHKTGDSWEGSLAQDITVNNALLWKTGTRVTGIVNQSTPTGRLANGEGALSIKLTGVGASSIDGGMYLLAGDAKGGRNAKVIGTTAALGALVGILSDKNNKNDHALGGAAIGAAVGTAVAAGTANTVIKIPTGKAISFVLPADERIVSRN